MQRLDNIVAASGGLPPETGNAEDDIRELRGFLDRLLKALERNFDEVGQFMEEMRHGT